MHPIVTQIQTGFAAAADPDKAAEMQAYMKTSQPFYGVQAKDRRRLARQACKKYPIKSFSDYRDVVLQLWRGPHREDMYAALEVATFCKKCRTDEAMPLYLQLLEKAQWWDTLDWIASGLIGELVLHNREFETVLEGLMHHENLWRRRASLLAHLNHKQATNSDLLRRTIEQLMDERDFFIRKAIGWVLRQYGRARPDWVKAFVADHQERLSALSKREALKHLQA